MNFVQEVLNLLVRKQNRDKLELTRDWFEFGRTKTSRLATPAYSPKMTPHAIRYDDLKCNIISGLVEGTGTEHTLPMWSTVNENNCSVQTIVDSIFSQDAGASEGLVSGDFRVTGNTVLEGDLLVLGQQTIVESTVVQVADNIFRINSTGAPLDAGIEVIMPTGTKTWAWDLARDAWSTFGENAITRDMVIDGKLVMDNEGIDNIVNEAEGLASNDNDQSLATVAAIKDYVDNQARDYVVDVQLTGDDLQFTGVGAAFSGTVNLSKYLDNTDTIDYISDIQLVNTSLEIQAVGNAFQGPVDLSSIADVPVVLTGTGGITISGTYPSFTIDGSSLADTNDIDYVSDVQLNGTFLEFTGVGNAFNASVDLSDLDATYDLEGVANIANGVDIRLVGSGALGVDVVTFNPGSNIAFTDLGGGVFEIAASGGGGMALSDIVAGDKINVSVNGGAGTVTVSHQTTTTTPTTSAQSLTYGGTFDAIVDVTHDAYGHITGYDTRTFTMPLSSGSPINYTAGAGLDLNGTEFSLTDVSRTNSSSTESPAHAATFTVIDDITTNAKGQVTAVNVKNVTLPTSGTGADGVITNVTFASDTSTLTFTGSGGGFNGDVDLSSLLDDTNATYTLGLAGGGSNDTVVTLTGAGGGASSQFTIAGGAGISVVENLSTNTIAISSTVTDTNDIDYISDVALNGNSLDFTGVGNAFGGSIDLTAYLDNTDTEYALSVATQAAGARVSLNGTNGNVDSVDFLPGSGISMSLTNNQLTIASTVTDTNDYISDVVLNGTDLQFTAVGSAFGGAIDLAGLDTNTTYDLTSGQDANDVNIRLSGSDATSDNIKLVAGTNITLTDNGANEITIDAAGGGASYTFGTYLTETGGTVNHDATTRSDSTSQAAPAHGATFTAVDSVTTNATGHVTGINVKTVTLPDGVVSCSYGEQWTGSRTVNSTTYSDIMTNGAGQLGIQNVAGKPIDVTISWTIQIAVGSTSSATGFNTRLEQFDQGGNSVGTVIEWKDSQSISAEYPICRTYTATVNDLSDQYMLIVQIAKPTAISSDFDLQQAAISVNITACDGDTGGGYAQQSVRA